MQPSEKLLEQEQKAFELLTSLICFLGESVGNILNRQRIPTETKLCLYKGIPECTLGGSLQFSFLRNCTEPLMQYLTRLQYHMRNTAYII